MEEMSTYSGNKLTEEQIEQLIKWRRGVENTVNKNKELSPLVCLSLREQL
jgi:hypothetical protein